MTTRILPVAEWARLEVTEARDAWEHLDPDRNRVIVAEHDGAIVGCVILMQAVHAEFFWIAEAHRGRVSVFRRIRERMVAEARAWRAPVVLASAVSDQMRCILGKLGAQSLPGDHYVLNLQEWP